jgi:hypothetical protein
MHPQQLPPELRPQTVSTGGAVFTYIDKERLWMTVLSLNGKKLNSDVVWASGDVSKVLVTLSNPLDMMLQFTSLSLHVGFTPTTNANEEYDVATLQSASTTIPLPTMVTRYVVNGVMLEPRATKTLELFVLPMMQGVLHLQGVECRIGQLEFSNPILVPMIPVWNIPVLARMPRVECVFSANEVELFAGQHATVKATLVNVGDVLIERLNITAHSATCQLVNCEGCLERQSTNGTYEATVVVSRLVLQDALPLGVGESVDVEVLLVAPPSFKKVIFDHVIFRMNYSPSYPTPLHPEGVPPSVPVFAVVPRRIMESRLRLRTIPSLVVTDISLTADRRFVESRVRNESERHTIELLIGGGTVEPFPQGTSSLLMLAGAELILPPIEISKLPDRSTCMFHLPWFVERTLEGNSC